MRFIDWETKTYLDQYFPENKVSRDEIEILKFIRRFLVGYKKHFNKMLDFGAGPVVHRLFPFAPYVNKIYIAEFLENSLKEVLNWKRNNNGQRNWNSYIRKVLEIENMRSDSRSIKKRAILTRKKISGLIEADIFNKKPLGKGSQFPLVTSFYCLDAVTNSKIIWFKLMQHLSSMVCHDGWLIISASRNINYSLLGNKKMPNVRLKETDLRFALKKLGYKVDTIEIKVINARMWSQVGITSVMIAKAQKI